MSVLDDLNYEQGLKALNEKYNKDVDDVLDWLEGEGANSEYIKSLQSTIEDLEQGE